MVFLIDHNIEGYAVLLFGTLGIEGWIYLAVASDDRTVWRFAQAQQMILLTANRSMKGLNSLEQTLCEENTLTSLPIVTIANIDRLVERNYREDCAARIAEIVVDIDNFKGAGRLFIL